MGDVAVVLFAPQDGRHRGVFAHEVFEVLEYVPRVELFHGPERQLDAVAFGQAQQHLRRHGIEMNVQIRLGDGFDKAF